MPPSSVHFNGSVNLPDAETVMQEISSRIPVGVRRITDGETGDRNYWIMFQIQKFLAMPEFEPVAVGTAYDTSQDAPQMPQLRLVEGASADTIRWPDLGYADAYAESFETFDRLQQDGTIAAGARFQMQYPTPLASMAGTIVPEDQPAVAASYERALFADLDKVLGRLPRDRCAVQWDVAVEFGLLEGAMGPGSAMPMEQLTPGLVRCVDHVPGDVPSDCTSVTATTGTSTSSNPSRCWGRWISSMPWSPPRSGRSTAHRSPSLRRAAMPTSSRLCATWRPDRRPSSTSRSFRTTPTISPMARPLRRSSTSTQRWRGPQPGAASGGPLHGVRDGTRAADDVPRLLDLHREILAA